MKRCTLQDYSSEIVEAEIHGYELPDEKEARLREANQRGAIEVNRAAGIGAFVMNRRAAEILNKLILALERIPNDARFQYHNARTGLVLDALRAMTAEAKRDLRT